MRHELWPYEVEKVESSEEGEAIGFKPVTLTIAKVFDDAWKFREDETQDGQYRGAFWKTPYQYEGPMFSEGATVVARLRIKPGRNGGLFRTVSYIRPADGAAVAPAAGASSAPRGGATPLPPSPGSDPTRASIERQVAFKGLTDIIVAGISVPTKEITNLDEWIENWKRCFKTLWGEQPETPTVVDMRAKVRAAVLDEEPPAEDDEDVEELPW